jgi:hypothetical protein
LSAQQKSQPRLVPGLGVAAGSIEAFCTVFLGFQHFTPTLRLPASPKGKEAVGKGEVIKNVCATHFFRSLQLSVSEARWLL